MGRKPKEQGDDLEALNALEAKLNAELKEVGRRKAAAHAKAQDAGRGTFMAALDRVRIGPMEDASARTIAKAIAASGGDAIAAQLTQTPA